VTNKSASILKSASEICLHIKTAPGICLHIEIYLGNLPPYVNLPPTSASILKKRPRHHFNIHLIKQTHSKSTSISKSAPGICLRIENCLLNLPPY
jgi:hypothetical protein